MFKYLIATFLTLIAIGCGILLIIFLASAAMFGSMFLTIGCIGAVFVFFYCISVLNRNHETGNEN